MPKTDAPASPQPLLGRRLRALRTRRALSLDDVADGTGVSRSFLSLIESGRSDISIGRLLRLAEFYGVGLMDLLPREPGSQHEIVKREDRLLIDSPGERVRTWVLASDPSGTITSLLAAFDPGAEAPEFRRHLGTEFVIVLEGQGTVRFADGSATVLDEGDSACFESQRLHAYANTGAGPMTLLSVAIAAA